tara:strand:+ start:1136 stop:2731 length:1596 start_codon:yes stop_codon:yes gene_type:complete
MAIPVDPSTYMYYYNTGGGNNAPSESYYCGGMPIGINPYDNTHLDLYYPSIKGCSAVDTIRLTITAGKHKQISDILVKEFLKNNAAPVPVGQDPIITIFDGDKSPIYKIQQDILGVSITYGTGCSSGGGGTMSNWTLSDGGTTQLIENSETVLFSDGTFINNVVSATNTVTTDLSAVDGTAVAGTKFLSKDNTWDVPITGVSGTVNKIPKFTSTTAIGNSIMSQLSTDLIAITAPTNAALSFYKGTNERLLITASDNYTQITNKATSHLLFKTSGNNNALTIQNSNDRVGIGNVTSALSSLHVLGNITQVDGQEAAGRVLTCNAAGTGTWVAPAASGCADVYKTITGTTGSTVASGCSDTLTIQSPNSSITADAATQDTLKLSARKYESFVITMTDEARPITLGTKYTFRIPYNFTYSWYGGVITTGTPCNAPFKLTVNTPPGGSEAVALTINVEASTNNGSSWGSVFSTPPSIDGGEYSSVTGSAQMVLAGSVIQASISCDTLLRFTVSKITGSAIGLKCTMVGYQSSIV